MKFTVNVFQNFPKRAVKRTEKIQSFEFDSPTIDKAREIARLRAENSFKGMKVTNVTMQPPGNQILVYVQAPPKKR